MKPVVRQPSWSAMFLRSAAFVAATAFSPSSRPSFRRNSEGVWLARNGLRMRPSDLSRNFPRMYALASSTIFEYFATASERPVASAMSRIIMESHIQ